MLRDKLCSWVVKRATWRRNMQRNNVARQVVRFCCSYYRSFIPFKLWKSFLVACLFGEAAISNNILMESFRAYISQDERGGLSSAQCFLG
jgi:hypothetical protein